MSKKLLLLALLVLLKIASVSAEHRLYTPEETYFPVDERIAAIEFINLNRRFCVLIQEETTIDKIVDAIQTTTTEAQYNGFAKDIMRDVVGADIFAYFALESRLPEELINVLESEDAKDDLYYEQAIAIILEKAHQDAYQDKAALKQLVTEFCQNYAREIIDFTKMVLNSHYSFSKEELASIGS